MPIAQNKTELWELAAFHLGVHAADRIQDADNPTNPTEKLFDRLHQSVMGEILDTNNWTFARALARPGLAPSRDHINQVIPNSNEDPYIYGTVFARPHDARAIQGVWPEGTTEYQEEESLDYVTVVLPVQYEVLYPEPLANGVVGIPAPNRLMCRGSLNYTVVDETYETIVSKDVPDNNGFVNTFSMSSNKGGNPVVGTPSYGGGDDIALDPSNTGGIFSGGNGGLIPTTFSYAYCDLEDVSFPVSKHILVKNYHNHHNYGIQVMYTREIDDASIPNMPDSVQDSFALRLAYRAAAAASKAPAVIQRLNQDYFEKLSQAIVTDAADDSFRRRPVMSTAERARY